MHSLRNGVGGKLGDDMMLLYRKHGWPQKTAVLEKAQPTPHLEESVLLRLRGFGCTRHCQSNTKGEYLMFAPHQNFCIVCIPVGSTRKRCEGLLHFKLGACDKHRASHIFSSVKLPMLRFRKELNATNLPKFYCTGS